MNTMISRRGGYDDDDDDCDGDGDEDDGDDENDGDDDEECWLVTRINRRSKVS